MNPQFLRETEPQTITTIPAGMLSAYRELIDQYGMIPSYDGEQGGWYLEVLDRDTPQEIIDQVLNSVSRNNQRILNWNEKATLLRDLGEAHLFVKGYLSGRPGFWALVEKGDGICCLYGEGCKPRSAKGYLKYIGPRLREIWPELPELESVAYHLGYYAAAHFRYSGKLPSFDGVDIHDSQDLREIL
jgi:hypothetical protein